jgi:hypothetical protein
MTEENKSSGSTAPDRTKEILTDFLDEEILRAHDSLRRSRMFGIILTCGVALYMGFLARELGKYLAPDEAARMTTIFIADQVQGKSDLIAAEIKSGIPGMITKLPDHFLSEMPKYRQNLEDSVISNSETHMRATVAALDVDLGAFLLEHQEDIKKLLESSEDLAITESFTDDLHDEILDFLMTVPADGESFAERLQRSLDVLQIAEERIDLLARNKNLSRTEQKTRYALAVLSQSITDQMHAMKMRIKADQ